MFILPTQQHFREWQIWWYAKRLNEETRTEGKRFLRNQLFKLKQEPC